MKPIAIAAAAVALLLSARPVALAQGEELLLDLDSMSPDERAHQLTKQAQEALASGDYARAEKLCDQATAGYRQELLAYWVLWQARKAQAEPAAGLGADNLAEEWRGDWRLAPQDPISSFKAGIADEAEGKYADAAQKYQSVLDSAFDDPIVYARLGAVQAKLGRYEEAAGNLETATKLDPSLQDPYDLLPGAYIALKRWPEAEQVLAKVLKAKPGDRELLYQMTRVQAVQGKTREALRSAMQGIGTESEGATAPAFMWWLTAIWAARPTWLAMVLIWLIPTALAIPLWWLATRERPGLPDVWFAGVGFALAFVLFSPVTAPRLVTSPGNAWHQMMIMYLWVVPVLPLVLAFDAVWDRLRKHIRTKASTFAGVLLTWLVVVVMQQLLALRSHYLLNWWGPVGVTIVGILLLRRGAMLCDWAMLRHRPRQRYDRAIALLKTALKVDRTRDCRVRALTYLGDMSYLKGDLEGALRYSERAVDLAVTPVSGVAATNVAMQCAEMGRYDAALSFAEKARSFCGSVGAFVALPDVAYAYVMMRQGQHYYALHALDVASRKPQVSKELRTATKAIRARSLAMLGDFPGATALCQEVTKTGGHHDWRSFAHTTMGIMWASSGNWQEALQQFFNATQALPSNAEACLRRAQGLAAIEDWDEAWAALEKTVEVAPVSQWARIAIEKLEGDPEGWADMNLPMPEVPQAYAAPEQPAYGYPPTQPMPYGPPPEPQPPGPPQGPPEAPLGSPVRRPQEPSPPPRNESN